MKNVRLLGLILSFGALPCLASAQESNAPAPLPNPLTIDAALAYAVEHSPILLQVRDRVAEQEGVLIEARAKQLPSVGVSGQYGLLDDGLIDELFGLKIGQKAAWQVDLAARQIVYAGGAVQAQARSSRERLAAARLAMQSSVNDTLLQVREYFYDVLLNREQIQVQEEALNVLELELKRANDREGAGTGSSFDALRAEVSVANARTPLIRARNRYQVAQDELRHVMGAPSTGLGAATDLNVTGSLDVTPVSFSLSDAVSAAQSHRPELLSDEKTVTAARYLVTTAKGGYLPSVSVYGGYRWEKSGFTGNTLNGLNGGVQLDWSIFDGKATAGRVQQARAREQQAIHAQVERKLSIDLEVRKSYAALTEAADTMKASAKVVEQARRSLNLAVSRHDAGTATQLDVLQSQSALTEAHTNYTQSERDYLVAVASLRRAMGTAETVALTDGKAS